MGTVLPSRRREVVEAAKRFSEPVLYTLAGLSISGLKDQQRREEEGL
jgi:hypothetical protein